MTLSRRSLLQHLLRRSGDPLVRLVLLILMETFNTPSCLPESLKPFDHFYVKWRVWGQEQCSHFLHQVLGANNYTFEALNCDGFEARTQLYRMLQVRP